MLTIFISFRNFKLCCPSNSIALQIVLTEKTVGEIIVLRNPIPGNTVLIISNLLDVIIQGCPDRGPRAQIWVPDRLFLGP